LIGLVWLATTQYAFAPFRHPHVLVRNRDQSA
jgi:hypothetical protein